MKKKSALVLAPVAAASVLFLLMGEEQSFAVLRDPLKVWTERSPGERDAGALFSIKPERKQLPMQRVLPAVREHPALAPEDETEELPSGLSFDTEPVLPDAPTLVPDQVHFDENLITPPRLVINDPPVIYRRYFVTPGGIPEPSTWFMMIMGVFGIGAAMRRKNRRSSLAGTDSLTVPSA